MLRRVRSLQNVCTRLEGRNYLNVWLFIFLVMGRRHRNFRQTRLTNLVDATLTKPLGYKYVLKCVSGFRVTSVRNYPVRNWMSSTSSTSHIKQETHQNLVTLTQHHCKTPGMSLAKLFRRFVRSLQSNCFPANASTLPKRQDESRIVCPSYIYRGSAHLKRRGSSRGS